jgi:hypothetical protein
MMVARSKLQCDLDDIALVLSTATAALAAGRYNQLNGLLLGALEAIAGTSRDVRRLEDELARCRMDQVESIAS